MGKGFYYRSPEEKEEKKLKKEKRKQKGIERGTNTSKVLESLFDYKSKTSTPEGKLKMIYSGQEFRNKWRKHGEVKYTEEELLNKFKNDPTYLMLFKEWTDSGRDKNLAPSFDRLDNSKGYSFDNIKCVTWKENFETSPFMQKIKNSVTRSNLF